MATSGSVDFNPTALQIIKGALRAIRAIDPGKTPSNDEISDAMEALNMLLKQEQARGLQLWVKTEATLFLDKTTQKYSFPTAYCTSDTFADTTTSAAASSGASTIAVSSATNISASDFLSIELDSGSRQWTTVGSISGTTITLPTGTTLSGAVASGNEVIAFTNKVDRPLKILDARRIVSSVETPLEIDSRDEYFAIPTKSTTGTVNEIYYSPQLDTGDLYVWPTGNTATDRIGLTLQRPIDDIDATTDTIDIPVEWMRYLKYQLAVDIAPEYGTPTAIYNMVLVQANSAFEIVDGWDAEMTDVKFVVDL